MMLKVDITDEAVITALQSVGEIIVKNASESLLGTNLKTETAKYTILRNGEEVTAEDLKKERGMQHTQAKYELKITIEV